MTTHDSDHAAGDNSHSMAMDTIFKARMAGARGDRAEEQRLSAEAFELEMTAIAHTDPTDRLSYSLLHRSAGWIAYTNCNKPGTAIELAAHALASDPHPEIRHELKALLEAAHRRVNRLATDNTTSLGDIEGTCASCAQWRKGDAAIADFGECTAPRGTDETDLKRDPEIRVIIQASSEGSGPFEKERDTYAWILTREDHGCRLWTGRKADGG